MQGRRWRRDEATGSDTLLKCSEQYERASPGPTWDMQGRRTVARWGRPTLRHSSFYLRSMGGPALDLPGTCRAEGQRPDEAGRLWDTPLPVYPATGPWRWGSSTLEKIHDQCRLRPVRPNLLPLQSPWPPTLPCLALSWPAIPAKDQPIKLSPAQHQPNTSHYQPSPAQPSPAQPTP